MLPFESAMVACDRPLFSFVLRISRIFWTQCGHEAWMVQCISPLGGSFSRNDVSYVERGGSWSGLASDLCGYCHCTCFWYCAQRRSFLIRIRSTRNQCFNLGWHHNTLCLSLCYKKFGQCQIVERSHLLMSLSTFIHFSRSVAAMGNGSSFRVCSGPCIEVFHYKVALLCLEKF